MGLLSFLGFTANNDEKKAKQAVGKAITDQSSRRQQLDKGAGQARNRYVKGLNAFDPREYMREAAGGVGAELQENLLGTISASNQQLNARGFYGGGLNTAKVTKDFNDRLARALAALSFDAAGLELSKLGGYGDLYSTDAARSDYARGEELDLNFDRFAMERDDRSRRLSGTLSLARSAIQAAAGGGGG